MKKKALTIILPLHGKPEYTKRFIKYCSTIELPYKIIVAEGLPSEAHAIEVKKELYDSCLDFEYLEFPENNYSDFYRKMYAACVKANTRYVMQVDNDDFIFVSAINELIRELDENPLAASARGRIAGFRLIPTKPYGPLGWWRINYGENYNTSTNSSVPVNRAIDSIGSMAVSYYNVLHRETCLKILEEIVRFNFTDLNHHETYFTARLNFLGKEIYRPDIVHYARQIGTSMNLRAEGRFFTEFLRSNYTEEYKMIGSMLGIDERTEPDFVEAYSKILRRAFLQKYEFSLSTSFESVLKKININFVFYYWPKVSENLAIIFASVLPAWLYDLTYVRIAKARAKFWLGHDNFKNFIKITS